MPVRWSLGLVLGILLPIWVAAEERAASQRSGMTATGIKVSRAASALVFAAQAQERGAAAKAGMAELKAEAESLRKAVQQLASSERGESLGAPGDPAGAAARRVQHRQELKERLQEASGKRDALESRLDGVAGARQRNMARRALEKLAALAREAREAADAPPEERAGRLAALGERLTVQHHGSLTPPGPDEAASPTVQLLPTSPFSMLEFVE